MLIQPNNRTYNFILHTYSENKVLCINKDCFAFTSQGFSENIYTCLLFVSKDLYGYFALCSAIILHHFIITMNIHLFLVIKKNNKIWKKNAIHTTKPPITPKGYQVHLMVLTINIEDDSHIRQLPRKSNSCQSNCI